MDSYKIETKQDSFAPIGTLLNNRGYNPYRDELGRFASGPSSSSDIIFSYKQSDIYEKNELGFLELKDNAINKFQNQFLEANPDEFALRQYDISSYQNTEYKEINKALRKGEKLEDIKPVLSDVFDMSFNENITTYRGENSPVNHWRVKVGDKAPESFSRGIVSTSMIPDVADYFAGKGQKYKTFITMNVEKETKCVIPQLYTSDLKNEAEVAFPPNTKMIVKSIKEEKQGPYIIQKIVLDVKK